MFLKFELVDYNIKKNYIFSDMGALNPLKWKMRTFAYVSVAILAFYVFFIFKKKHHVSFDGVVKNAKPETVWEFVADFNNMMKLNPTM